MEEDFFKELLKTEGIPLDPAKDAEYAPLSSAEQNHSVHEVFSMYPELAHIGTEEEYSSYLATVFPETKVPDIVWHNSPDMIPEFKKQEEGAGQFHFAKGKESIKTSVDALKLLQQKTSMIKRPVIEKDGFLFFGFDEGIYKDELLS